MSYRKEEGRESSSESDKSNSYEQMPMYMPQMQMNNPCMHCPMMSNCGGNNMNMYGAQMMPGNNMNMYDAQMMPYYCSEESDDEIDYRRPKRPNYHHHFPPFFPPFFLPFFPHFKPWGKGQDHDQGHGPGHGPGHREED
jgi:hypothetical protein